MKKMDIPMMARMIMLRGLGYKHTEIAEQLKVSPNTISYQLGRLRKLAEEHGPEDVFEYHIKGLELKKAE